MAENTKIEWADHTFNPVIGCSKVSPGCDNCYAEAMAKRYGWHDWQNDTPRYITSDANWAKPLKWNREAAASGERRRVFCASLADVFDPHAPRDQRKRLWDLIEQTPHLDWLLLTKRPQQIRNWVPNHWLLGFPSNVWLGFTAENQQYYDLRWPYVAELPAVVRFVSYEPALGPIEPTYHKIRGPDGLITRLVWPDWWVVGGESGPHARPMRAAWARVILENCAAAGKPFHFKQWGSYESNPLTAEVGLIEAKLRDPAKVNGKGGALLDGKLHRAIPDPLVLAA